MDSSDLPSRPRIGFLVMTGGGARAAYQVGELRAISLLDSLPFAHLLNTRLDFGAIQGSIDRGDLYAFGVTCSGYTSGQPVTFYQGVAGLEPQQERIETEAYPSLAQITGRCLDSIFLDSLKVDPERLKRINRTLSVMPRELLQKSQLSPRQVDFRLIYPSIALGKIAIGHMHTLPRNIRAPLFTLGALKKSGSNLVSCLLFGKEYRRALIKLGYDDTMQRRDDPMQFLGYDACWL